MNGKPDDNQTKKNPELEGEGSYKASKSYDDAAKKFAQSGQADAAARKAAGDLETEKEDLQRAEDAGKAKSAGEDPLLHDKE